MWPAAIAAACFLALTGWRSGQALTLRWERVDIARRNARPPDTNAGESLRPLSAAACDVLRAQGQGALDALVFPPSRDDGTMTGFPLPVRPHREDGRTASRRDAAHPAALLRGPRQRRAA